MNFVVARKDNCKTIIDKLGGRTWNRFDDISAVSLTDCSRLQNLDENKHLDENKQMSNTQMSMLHGEINIICN